MVVGDERERPLPFSSKSKENLIWVSCFNRFECKAAKVVRSVGLVK